MAKRMITSLELPEKMLYDLKSLAGSLMVSKSDLIRWGIEYILKNPPIMRREPEMMEEKRAWHKENMRA